MLRKKGQVSIMMIMLLIVTLFFYGISFGWRMTAKAKVSVTNAATLGAAYVSSMYTSYAWMLSNVYLKGKTFKKKCQTNWALVLTVFVPGLWILTLPMAIMYDRGASAMAKGWNAQQKQSGVPVLDWLEGGLVTAMQYAVDDNAMIYDIADDDEDGDYCDIDSTTSLDQRKRDCPKVARVTHYMNRRVNDDDPTQSTGQTTGQTTGHNSSFQDIQSIARAIGQQLGLDSYKDFSDDLTQQACERVPEKCNSCCMDFEDRPSTCTPERVQECLADDLTTFDPMLSTKWNLNTPAGVFGSQDWSPRFKKEYPYDPASPLVLDSANINRTYDYEGVIHPLLALMNSTNIPTVSLTQWNGETYETSPDFIDGVNQDLSTKIKALNNIQVSVTHRKDEDLLTDDEIEAFEKGEPWPLTSTQEHFLSWMQTALLTTADLLHLIWTLPEGGSEILTTAEYALDDLRYTLVGIKSGLQKIPAQTSVILDMTYPNKNAWCGSDDSSATLSSIVNCLADNMNNQQKFDRCLDSCSEFCHDLPRSLVQLFNPNEGQDCSPNSAYLQNIQRSAFLAQEQDQKFQQRWQYLNYILNAIVAIDNAAAVAKLQFNGLTLDKRIENLQNAQRRFLDQKQDEKERHNMDSDIVYGWMSPPPKDQTRGQWHVVGVQGSAGCAGTHARGREPWIRIKKKRKRFKVCLYYYLEGTANKAEMTVWRWDEDLNALNRLFKGSFDSGLGNDLLQDCVQQKDKNLWCLDGGIDYKKGECSGTADPFWLPAFVGILEKNKNTACKDSLLRVKDQAIQSKKTVSAGGANTASKARKYWPPTFRIH